MKRIRSFCIFLLLMITLLAMVFVPPAISRIKDWMLFGKVTTQSLVETEIAKNTVIDAADKIALISRYNLGQENIVMVSQERQITAQNNTEDIVDIVLNELEKLKGDGVFPQITIDNIQYFDYTMKSYTNMDQPSINAEIWDITFYFDNNEISLLMDVNTHLIYQFNVWSKEPMPIDAAKEIPQNFAAYLGIEWDTAVYNSKLMVEQYTFNNREIAYLFSQSADGRNYGISIITSASVITN